jgi:hypothetical protein
MRLSGRSLEALADMVCGDKEAGTGRHSWGEHFPYRSSSYLTRFFRACDLQYSHDGSTRKWWVLGVLEEINKPPVSGAALPSDALLRVIGELLDPLEFHQDKLDRVAAMEDLNTVLGRDGLQVYLDGADRAHVRNLETAESSAGVPALRRALTKEELESRAALEAFMDAASEDDFTDKVLVPLFRQLGFIRVATVGHRDRALEFGKDMWMKYQLPTNHYLYFGIQAKREKLDSAAGSLSRNIAAVLDQVRMALQDPVWDPETNRKNLIDHVIIVSAGEITKAAQRLMAENLDASQRRSILFLDREDILDLWLRVQLPVPGDQEEEATVHQDDGLPF